MISKDVYLSVLALTLIPFAALISKKLGKRMGKAVYGALEANEEFVKYLSEILKSVKLVKIFKERERKCLNFLVLFLIGSQKAQK